MRTVIDLDEEALTAAAEELGTTTKVATVNAALREIASRRVRREALDFWASGGSPDLLDPEVMGKAWR